MIRIVSVALCVLLLCFTLCACSRGETVTDMASEAVSEVASDADAIVSDGNGFIGDETTGDDDSATNNDTNNNTDNTTSDNTNDSNNTQDVTERETLVDETNNGFM